MAEQQHEFIRQQAEDAQGEEAGVKKPRGNGRWPLTSRALAWPDLTKLPAPDYIVKGLIERGTLVEIYGPTQSGKSFLATDIALHVALGRQWCGHRVRQGGVLYVSAEGGTAIVKRLQAFAQHHGVAFDDLDFRAVIASSNLLDQRGIDQLIVDAQSVPRLALVIIDTAARVMPGSKEDAEDMGRLVGACDAIRNATGAAVLLVHHTGKDEARGSRGSSVLPAAVDANLSVTKKEKISTVELEKSRDGETGPVCSFGLKVINLGEDGDGDPITSCVVLIDEGVGKAPRRQPSLKGAAKIALKTLEKAISEAGVEAPASNHIPSGRRGVDLEKWRRYHYAGTSDGDQSAEARRKAFQRDRKELEAAEVIGVHDGFIWRL